MTTIVTRAIAIAVLLASSFSFAVAQGLHMEIGLSQRIELPDNVANVIVGNPDVADVLPITSNTYILHARSVGTTNIIAVDDVGGQIFYARLQVRPVDMVPRFVIHVTHGIRDARRYVCDHVHGCRSVGGLTGPLEADPEIQPAGAEQIDPELAVQPAG